MKIMSVIVAIWMLIVFTACGKDGAQGTPGIQGVAGLNGTTVSTVKFCPGVPDTYASSFPEYGLCLDNKVYAVYWNGSTSFLAYLTPGKYVTTSTGANCNFEVVANSCEVTNY